MSCLIWLQLCARLLTPLGISVWQFIRGRGGNVRTVSEPTCQWAYLFNTHGHWKTSPVVCWLTLHLPVPGACIPSLVGKLRSHMPWGVAKKKETCSGRPRWARVLVGDSSLLLNVHVKEGPSEPWESRKC